MIPAVLLLAKYSVFEMLWLESDIQQTNGTFVSDTDAGDWKKWWRLVFNSAFLQLVCCNVRPIYLYYLPVVFQFYNWNSSFVYLRKTEQWWISPGLHTISVPYKENKSTCKFEENWQVKISEKACVIKSGKFL